ncbi:hypothetical protein N836_09240 [Leptolyngbya sp. Heron Island J]|uniref:hypothetical protein n=1 Tax=Leptolyngbya sp. Heron Island J TaxID=1385935 RepID=UPI0003B9F93B|nr:hypothetical protein [Leptolyngbya sp. Heron Island J]ESA35996.1 hypothetical protein N836_09240 [Leptolyngbya sp. Heron Island J]
MGLNIMLRSQYRANVQQLSRPSSSTERLSLGNWPPSLVWSLLAMPLWTVWFWRFIRTPKYLWAYGLHRRIGSSLLVTNLANTHFWLGIVYGGAAIGLVYALLWQSVWQRPVWADQSSSHQSSANQEKRLLLAATVGGALWFFLFTSFGFLIPLIDHPSNLELIEKWPLWAWSYLVLHLTVLSISTGPILGLLLLLKPWTKLQKTILGAIWGALALTAATGIADDNVLGAYQITPLPLGLRFTVSILLISFCLGLYSWYCYRRQVNGLWLASLGLGLVTLLSLGLSAQLTLSPALSQGANLWLTKTIPMAQPNPSWQKWTLLQNVWRVVTPLRYTFLWGAFLGSLIALGSSWLPLRQLPVSTQNNQAHTTSSSWGGLFKALLQVWPNHSRVWWWMAIWSGGWLAILSFLVPWSNPLVLWPQPAFLFVKILSRSGREQILDFGSFSPYTILEVVAISTFLGGLVGLVWQTTRQRQLFETHLQTWEASQRFSAGVFATAFCGGRTDSVYPNGTVTAATPRH